MYKAIPCPECGEIPVSEVHNIIPILNQTQLTIVACILVPMLIVCFVLAIRFVIKYIRDMREINQKE